MGLPCTAVFVCDHYFDDLFLERPAHHYDTVPDKPEMLKHLTRHMNHLDMNKRQFFYYTVYIRNCERNEFGGCQRVFRWCRYS